MGVPLRDLILNPDLEAKLRAAVGNETKGAAPAPSADLGGDLEFKDASTPGDVVEHKSEAPGAVQVLEADDQTGRIVALVSVTGVEDRVKDIIEPGAYTKTLAKHEPIGVWSHDDKVWVARTEDAVELMPGDPLFRDLKTMDGQPWPAAAGAVKVEALFNLETRHGRDAYSDVKFFKGKTGWSIGYRATKAHRNPRTGVRSIKELDWFEYSPVMVGAASQPMTLSVKSMAGAHSVDPDAAGGLVDAATLEALEPAELSRHAELKASLGLEVKASTRHVRTAAGAKRYGLPIGSAIVSSRVSASKVKVGDVIDNGSLGGRPADGKVTKNDANGPGQDITVEGDDGKSTTYKVGASDQVEVSRAVAPGAAGGKSGANLDNYSDADLEAYAARQDDAAAFNAEEGLPRKAEQARNRAAAARSVLKARKEGGGGAKPAAGKKPTKAEVRESYASKPAAELRTIRDSADSSEMEKGEAINALAKLQAADVMRGRKPAGDDASGPKPKVGDTVIVAPAGGGDPAQGRASEVASYDDDGNAVVIDHVRGSRRTVPVSDLHPATGKGADAKLAGGGRDVQPDMNPPSKREDNTPLDGMTDTELRNVSQNADGARGKAAGDLLAARLRETNGGGSGDGASSDAERRKDKKKAGRNLPPEKRTGGSTPEQTDGPRRDQHLSKLHKDATNAEIRDTISIYLEDVEDGILNARDERILGGFYDEQERRRRVAKDARALTEEQRGLDADTVRYKEIERLLRKLGGQKSLFEQAKLAHMNDRLRGLGEPELDALPLSVKGLDLTSCDDFLLSSLVAADPTVEVKGSSASLNRSPRRNWVEKAGELPAYVREVARSIEKTGRTLDEAIPIAIGRIKKWARGGDGVKPDTVAKASKAIAEWEALKGKSGKKYDSELLEHLESKALALLEQVDAAYGFLYEAGEFKADDADDALEVADADAELDALLGEPVEAAVVEPAAPVEAKSLPTESAIASDELARAAALRARLAT